MEIRTEIYLSDLTDDTKDQLIENIIDRLRDDKDLIKEITKAETIIIDEEIAEGVTDKETRNGHLEWRINERLEDKAKKILEDTFYGEISIGD